MPTATTPSSQASAAAAAVSNFLAVAPTRYMTVLGSVASGAVGGQSSDVVWARTIPTTPAFCSAVEYEITIPVSLTLAATTGAATVSPFAPYSAVGQQLTLGGAPPWPQTELTAWYLDDIIRHSNWDPAYPGLGNNEGYFTDILDLGPTPNQIGGSGSVNPGTALTNTTTAAVTTDYTFTFKLRQQLMRKRHVLWGAIPFGDPENRPDVTAQLLALVGTHPESNLFVAGDGATAQLTSAATVNATYELRYVDLLPPGMGSAPQPLVSYGLQVTNFRRSDLNAGTVYPTTHRTAMVYTAIHNILVNNQLPIRADYWSLWDDEDQQSAKWAYDDTNNTFVEWFNHIQRTYRRYFNTGHYFVDLEGGDLPEIPSVTPYKGVMTPSATLANSWGITVTPAMSTAIRIPSGTTTSNPYIKNYSFGFVPVPY